jgi:hypothetical protein
MSISSVKLEDDNLICHTHHIPSFDRFKQDELAGLVQPMLSSFVGQLFLPSHAFIVTPIAPYSSSHSAGRKPIPPYKFHAFDIRGGRITSRMSIPGAMKAPVVIDVLYGRLHCFT